LNMLLAMPLANASKQLGSEHVVVPSDDTRYSSVGNIYSGRWVDVPYDCSGVMVDPHTVLTAYHCRGVVKGAMSTVNYRTKTGESKKMIDWAWESSTTVPKNCELNETENWASFDEELVVIKLDSDVTTVPAARLISGEQLNKLSDQQEITLVGYPSFDFLQYKTMGQITHHFDKIFEVNALALGGYSGGGAFVEFNGETLLLGISVARNEDKHTSALVVPDLFVHISTMLRTGELLPHSYPVKASPGRRIFGSGV
jgi:V8-like Glu-specific endopeptidase